ncbi:c-type cytochrome [Ideonella azotifigens]|uniref:C-type cytochrome n=2 Tax=Ideonella azotifigens TaxID=513160 RepID=A0ABN1KKA6_9BURK|nr:c-type cytochrome [Ideonella azotifigens]MCD2339257.1 c-type cytochrome [Ideonella azotifigens]
MHLFFRLLCAVAMWASAAAFAAPVEDSMAQRVQACTGCHGAQGQATRQGYFPRIAGKPAGYLYNQLLSFRAGTRHNEAMGYLLAQLSDDYLREIAGHFASLDLPYPPAPPIQATAASLSRGAVLATQGDAARGLPACAACHGAQLTGVQPATPGLIGLPRDYLVAQLGAWQSGQRLALAPDCMASVARKLSVDDLNAVSSWLATQSPPAHARPAAALAAPAPLRCGSGAP